MALPMTTAIALAVALAQPRACHRQRRSPRSTAWESRSGTPCPRASWCGPSTPTAPPGTARPRCSGWRFSGPDILETAFGDEQAGGLEERLEDLHVQVLEGLRARIARGILRKSDWRGLYEVSLTFLDLKVGRLHEQNLEERRAVRVGVQVTLSTRFVLREVETGDRLHSEVIAARRARYFGGEQIEFRDLLEETVTSAYKTLSAKYDSLSASPRDR